MLLEALYCIWRSNHILWSLLTGFRRKRLSPFSLARDSGSILDFFYGCACPCPLAPSWERRFRVVSVFNPAKLSWMLRDSYLFFLWLYSEVSKVLCLLPIQQNWDWCWYPCAFCGGSHALSVGACATTCRGAWALTKRGSTEYWGYTSASWRGVQMRWPLEFMGCWDPCTSYCEPLSFSLLLAVPRLFSHANALSNLDRVRKIWVSWSATHWSGEAAGHFTHPFVHGRNCGLRVSFGTELCHLRRGIM